MYIIGIAGGTGSGKTTVARKIIESLPKGEVALIPQDSYYIDATDMTMEERRKINYDHPCAFDWKLLIRQVKELKAGRAIEQPTYSYLECNRLKETIHVEPRKVILIEGILALSNKELRDLMDIKIFVDADSDERLIRVIERDIIERGRTVQMVVDRYRAVSSPCIWNSSNRPNAMPTLSFPKEEKTRKPSKSCVLTSYTISISIWNKRGKLYEIPYKRIRMEGRLPAMPKTTGFMENHE